MLEQKKKKVGQVTNTLMRLYDVSQLFRPLSAWANPDQMHYTSRLAQHCTDLDSEWPTFIVADSPLRENLTGFAAIYLSSTCLENDI